MRLATSLTIVLLLFQFSVQGQSMRKLVTQGNVAAKNYFVEIPFGYESRHLFIDVEINNKTYNFLFDTGFDMSVADKSILEDIEFKSGSKAKTTGSSFEKTRVVYGTTPKISIGQVEFKSIGIGLMDLEFINESCRYSRHVDGVIGANLLRKSNWQIDYEKLVIRFSDKTSALKRSENAVVLDMISKGWGSTLLDIQIADLTTKFKFDTGSSGKLTIGPDFLEALKAQNNNLQYATSTRGNELTKNESYQNHMVLIDSIAVGSIALTNQIISLEKDVSSLLGNQFLENYLVTIDWKNNKLYLDPVKQVQNDTLSTHGLILSPNLSSNQIEIVGMYDTKVDYDVKVGSKISAINGQDVSNFTTSELCDFWKTVWPEIKSEEQINIIVQEDSREKEIVLEKTVLLSSE